MLALLLMYSLVKRTLWLKERVIKYASLRALLGFHIYAGVIGALLGIIHTGHKFHSPLGIGLVTAMLTVVFTGFIGRYYLADVGSDLREQQQMLAVLRTRYDRSAAALAGGPATIATMPMMSAAMRNSSPNRIPRPRLARYDRNAPFHSPR